MTRNRILSYILVLTSAVAFYSCSMTKNIPDGDQLFTGLKKITYENTDTIKTQTVIDNQLLAQQEVEAALATAPNGAIFGSSYYRMPFSLGVSIWNKYANTDTPFARWMTKTFGKQPVLMSWVNPELRAKVAQGVLRNHGYFSGQVSYEPVPQKNPKTSKIAYKVQYGRLTTLDSVGYFGFPADADSLIQATLDQSYVRKGDAFSVSNLDAERQRISLLLRNNGYYYYQPGYASYLADTFAVNGKAQLRFQLADGVPEAVMHKWYIGRVNINMRKTNREVLTDSTVRRYLTVRYSGKKPPVSPRVLMADMKLRPRQLYSYDNYLQTASKINANGLFSMTDFVFTPRDTTAACDTLDLNLNLTFDKPWDFYIETNFNARTIGRMGPEVRMGITRRNAFRGAEKINFDVHGSYEWSTQGNNAMNNYEYGADLSVEFPRIIAPFFGGNRVRRDQNGRVIRRRRFFSTPSTVAKVSTDIIYRPSYYKMHVASGEWTYRWQTSPQSRHEFSPLTVKYQFMNSHTDSYDSLLIENPYLEATMEDRFITEMRYTYTYTSPSDYRNPIRWETTIAEAGNGVALYDVIMGRSWNEKDKKLFKNPYSQFLKFETDFTKTWSLGDQSKLLAHINGGIIYCYGNCDATPHSEMFYAGGANSIRAFSVRGLGPGGFRGVGSRAYNYLLQNGEIKLVMNLEYRRQLFGDLHGAVFLDAGNVWFRNQDVGELNDLYPDMFKNLNFSFNSLFQSMGVGTGIGLRYDLNFLILRLDWGVALHYPWETGKSGFYNIDSFKGSHTLHFAIGYPF